MDANDYTRIHHLIDTIAMHTVVHIDDLTLGPHPDASARQDGKLALIDWSRAGGSIVGGRLEASVMLTRRTSPARALGAALAAAVKVDDQIGDDLPLLSGLAVGANNLTAHTAGGPADAPLRLALCVRGLALGMMGEEGDARSGYDADYNWRKLGGGMDREEAQLGVEARDFAALSAVAFLPLTEGDRALLGAVS